MIVAFYAYKGGTGRSAAVANVAPVLSRAGYRVIVVDLDLDAPGLHRFFGLSDADTCKPGIRGFVELCAEYQQALSLASKGDAPGFQPLALEHLLEPQRADDVAVFGPRDLGGGLDAWVRVLPAGAVDAAFPGRSRSFDWSRLYAQEDWRQFFGWLRSELARLADVVFIDARTGVTDVGALAISALADRVILLSPPTSQGLDGAALTARALRGNRGLRHAGMLVPARIADEAYPDHWAQWLARAKAIATAEDLLDYWTVSRGLAPEDARRAVERMIDFHKIPEVPLHSVGEPLVKRRMLDWNRAEDRLQDAYERLGAEIHRWIAQAGREQAKLGGDGLTQVRESVAAARREKDAARLAWLRLEESDALRIKGKQDEAARIAQIGLGNAEAIGDEVAAVSLLLAEARATSDIDRAARLIDDAIERAGGLDQSLPKVEALLAKGDLELLRPDVPAARQAFRDAVEASDERVPELVAARLAARLVLCDLFEHGEYGAATAGAAGVRLMSVAPTDAARFQFWRVFNRCSTGRGGWPAPLASGAPAVRAVEWLSRALQGPSTGNVEEALRRARIEGEGDPAVETLAAIHLGICARDSGGGDQHQRAAEHWTDAMLQAAEAEPELRELAFQARIARLEVLDRLEAEPDYQERLLRRLADEVPRIRPFFRREACYRLAIALYCAAESQHAWAANAVASAAPLYAGTADAGRAFYLAAGWRLSGDVGLIEEAVRIAKSGGVDKDHVEYLERCLRGAQGASSAQTLRTALRAKRT